MQSVNQFTVLPAEHPDACVEATRPYLTSVVLALCAAGISVERSWLDPSGPRDATIVVASEGSAAEAVGAARRGALVWDEETGWRYGQFVSGRQGERTVLDFVAYLGYGVLPHGAWVAEQWSCKASRPKRVFRRCVEVLGTGRPDAEFELSLELAGNDLFETVGNVCRPLGDLADS